MDQLLVQDILRNFTYLFPDGTANETILDIYSDQELFQEYKEEVKLRLALAEANNTVTQKCIKPVTTDLWKGIYLMLVFCFILRLLTFTKIPRHLFNIISIAMGVYVILEDSTREGFWYVMIPTTALLLLIQMKRFNSGILVCLLAVTYMGSCEMVFVDILKWSPIRGTVMCLMMSIIMLSFDQEKEKLPKDLTVLDHFALVFNPGVSIFGPAVTYQDYSMMHERHPMSLSWILHVILALITAFAFTLWAQCGLGRVTKRLHDYAPLLKENKFWHAFLDGHRFRFHQYFVSFTNETCLLLLGIGTKIKKEKEKSRKVSNNVNENEVVNKNEVIDDGKKEDEAKVTEEKETETVLVWSRPTTFLARTELPHSLIYIARYWNYPVHIFMKGYIFTNLKKYGAAPALATVYLFSGMMHSLNFQFTIILVSFGYFSYIEHVIRRSLSNRLSACIDSRKCRKICSHKYKADNYWVTCINLVFSFIAILNLAYFTCLFDFNRAEDFQGYSRAHVMKKWGEISFVMHIAMSCMYFIHLILKLLRVY